MYNDALVYSANSLKGGNNCQASRLGFYLYCKRTNHEQTGAANISNINVDHKRLTRHNLIKAMKPLFKKKEKTMYGHSNYNYFVKIYYIENNNKANETFIFDNRKEYNKFFDYVLKLRHNKDSNIYEIDFGHGYKVDTTTDAINKLIKWGEVLLPGADEHIDIMDMEFEEA